MKCIDAFKNINIEFKDGSVRISPCCMSPSQKRDSVDFINDSYLKEIRNIWSTGSWPKECSGCREQEQNGFTSRRQGANQWYKDNDCDNNEAELIRLDYYTGNFCNLACAICGPHNSSAWASELGMNSISYVQNKFWRDMDLTKLKYIHFNGGEPLLSKEHVTLLENIPNKSSVILNYNTNGTILPTQYLQDLWGQFKLIMLDFSIDDIGSRFEYQRFPAKWIKVVENLNWFRENSHTNTMFGINLSLGVLNNGHVDELTDWVSKNFPSNRLGDEVSIKKQMTHGTLSLENLKKNPASIVRYLDSLDGRRGSDWRSTFPELAKVL
jgi:sulfatase maturation enzyme AslB (radical SAM superfamily)